MSPRRVLRAFLAARRRWPSGRLSLSPCGLSFLAPSSAVPGALPGGLVAVSLSWPAPFGVWAWRGFLPWWASAGGRSARLLARSLGL